MSTALKHLLTGWAVVLTTLTSPCIAAGTDGPVLEDLKSRYRGWAISIENVVGRPETFLARKQAAVA